MVCPRVFAGRCRLVRRRPVDHTNRPSGAGRAPTSAPCRVEREVTAWLSDLQLS